MNEITKNIFGDDDHPKEEKNAFGPKSASVVSPLLLTYVVSYMGTDRMASIRTGSQGHGIFLISALVMELFSSDALGQQKNRRENASSTSWKMFSRGQSSILDGSGQLEWDTECVSNVAWRQIQIGLYGHG